MTLRDIDLKYSGGALKTSKALVTGGPLTVNQTNSTASLPLGRAGALNTGINIASSFAGGEDNGSGTDTTGRLNLYSYQRAQNGSFGETIRHFLMRSDSKAMIAWYGPKAGYNETTEEPDESQGWSPWWWIGAHWEANDNASIHGHGSIEVPDLSGALQTRLEVPFIDQTNPPAPGQPIGVATTNIRTNLADFTVRASTGVLRIGASNAYNKDILLSASSDRDPAGERWKIRANNDTETGSGNAGTNFEIRRHADNGNVIETALSIERSTWPLGVLPSARPLGSCSRRRPTSTVWPLSRLPARGTTRPTRRSPPPPRTEFWTSGSPETPTPAWSCTRMASTSGATAQTPVTSTFTGAPPTSSRPTTPWWSAALSGFRQSKARWPPAAP
jgi:hypothetical protein